MKNIFGVPYDTKNMLRWLSDVISVFSWIVDIIDYTAFLIFGDIVFLYSLHNRTIPVLKNQY